MKGSGTEMRLSDFWRRLMRNRGERERDRPKAKRVSNYAPNGPLYLLTFEHLQETGPEWWRKNKLTPLVLCPDYERFLYDPKTQPAELQGYVRMVAERTGGLDWYASHWAANQAYGRICFVDYGG